ncbi:NAD-dependent epimerase [Acinetobacter sp. WZC-1]|uniref:NAD-dependent epimerase n=1 Tax=Acinetobacter sp. WZC-1 TaxID=3459034 RepID=UPI00403DDA06
MKILVTGVAGFIGYHVARQLLARGDEVIGLDHLNDYYDVTLKQARLHNLQPYTAFTFLPLDLTDRVGLAALFQTHDIQRVVHLAAQAGVRYSLQNPYAYADSNLSGFLNLLECCRHHHVEHLVYASSSSVYGANRKMPYAVSDHTDHPLSLYAASKKANELMAHAYSYNFNLATTGLRFFTVYGPWGRPDMSPFIFTRKILMGEAIDVFNYGHHRRDFTYIDDIADGVVRCLDQIATVNSEWQAEHPDPDTSLAPWRIYNIGNHQPVELLYYIQLIEQYTGCQARLNLLPRQPGDVLDTYADIDSLNQATGFRPVTTIEQGMQKFVAWYRDYYQL